LNFREALIQSARGFINDLTAVCIVTLNAEDLNFELKHVLVVILGNISHIGIQLNVKIGLIFIGGFHFGSALIEALLSV